MRLFSFIVGFILLWSAGGAIAADLDDFHLNRFARYLPGGTLAGVHVEQIMDAGDRCFTPLMRDLRRDWSKLLPATQQTLVKFLPSRPVFSNTRTYATTRFTIYYAGSGTDAPPTADSNTNGIPDYVELIGATLEDVHVKEVGIMGYAAPPLSGSRYDIYLQNVSTIFPGVLGYTDYDALAQGRGTASFTSYIVLDNDYTEFAGTFSSAELLQQTAAHEYHHAIQVGYSLNFESWYGEASATWIEDEVFDDVNQLYSYLNPTMNNTKLSLNAAVNVGTGGGYGRWLFNRQLAEQTGQSVALIRQIWQQMEVMPQPVGGREINAATLIDTILKGQGSSLADAFTNYVKKLYTHQWNSHTNSADQNAIGNFSPSPLMTVSHYPANGEVAAPLVVLQQLSSAWYQYVQGTSPPATLVITTSALPPGITVTAFILNTSGAVTEVPPINGKITINGFNGVNIDEVMLVLINPGLEGIVSSAEAFTPATGGGSSGGGGGCFIATAAYGSYLHPKVQVLRDFRDHFLLNTHLGRAFVAWYYRWSPGAAQEIAGRPLLQLMCRCLITPLIVTIEHPLAVFSGLFALASWGLCWRRRTVALVR